jgi:hypothetical protein
VFVISTLVTSVVDLDLRVKPRDPEAAGNKPPINHLCMSRDSDERPPDNDPIIPAHAAESRTASDRVFAHSARRSGVARVYDQAGGAREMAHETYLLARFEPLLE